jgi:hypothetical protein
MRDGSFETVDLHSQIRYDKHDHRERETRHLMHRFGYQDEPRFLRYEEAGASLVNPQYYLGGYGTRGGNGDYPGYGEHRGLVKVSEDLG